MGLGFGMKTGDDDDYDQDYTGMWGSSYGNQFYSVIGFLLDPTVGWKVDVGDPGGFFIEPLISVPIVLGNKEYDLVSWSGKDNSKFGAGVGFRLAFGMGYAF
jgi:hypothetical protein